MYENMTPEQMKKEILQNLTNLDTREGSFANNLVSPAALVIWNMIERLGRIIPISYVDENSSIYIDKKAEEFGLYRIAGSKATTRLMFTGENQTTIRAGSRFLSEDGHIYILEQNLTIRNGSATGSATAAENGESYNSPANTIVRQYRNQAGIYSVNNPDAATGGVDDESDIALITRLRQHWQTPAVSGKAEHYKHWAEEVGGVGKAKVILPSADQPGTVTVIITNSDNTTADDTIVEACQNFMDLMRPIGTQVVVQGAEPLYINVQMQLTMDKAIDPQKVEEGIRENLSNYIRTLAFSTSELIYNRIKYIVLNTEGVTDYTLLTVNGSSENVHIPENAVITIGNVEINIERILMETSPYDPNSEYFLMVDDQIETIDNLEIFGLTVTENR